MSEKWVVKLDVGSPYDVNRMYSNTPTHGRNRHKNKEEVELVLG